MKIKPVPIKSAKGIPGPSKFRKPASPAKPPPMNKPKKGK